jgi:hypothetical protein
VKDARVAAATMVGGLLKTRTQPTLNELNLQGGAGRAFQSFHCQLNFSSFEWFQVISEGKTAQVELKSARLEGSGCRARRSRRWCGCPARTRRRWWW